MGVPKFYRWISERYPCLSEVVKEFQIPEFDALYLDMNGIIHVCSHPEDDNPHFRITEEKIFTDVSYYIEFLFRMIKPRRSFFMAIDGVAPRAKMNQQRGRRFRSAREAEELEKKARDKGEILPTEKRFDSNCITPGTPFMARLQEYLKYFVAQKITTDPLWQNVKVILSGHETPGEGEHKIMDYIRYQKSSPDYDPNTRHCLYGLDADLMMLGLVSHEPHFSLLREEVRFGGKKDKNKRPATPEETTFHLLHLSLMREYIDFEFSDLKEQGKLQFEYSLESVIDDWVLMGFLVGNDFIPHLPQLHIHHDGLPLLWRTYKNVLPQLDGYLNDGGYLNLARFEKFMVELSKHDVDSFRDQFADLKWFEGKMSRKDYRQKARKNKQTEAGGSNPRKGGNQYEILVDLTDEHATDFPNKPHISGTGVEEPGRSSPDQEDGDTFESEFRMHKDNYYMTKMNYPCVTDDVLREQATEYVRAIQWILLYYFEGVPSWSWFYPHHYAPYMSDVQGFADLKIEFDLSRPFLPFQQLMAVLPAASQEILPVPYRSLMTKEDSPIVDFYPVDFSTDLNGKLQEWEAVVLIPFIEEGRLLRAMEPINAVLTDEEKARNLHGPHRMFEFSSSTLTEYPSPLPDMFPDITACRAKCTDIPMFEFRIPSKKIFKGLPAGVRQDVYFPGFPTMKHIPHSAELKKSGVRVFQMTSRGENMVVKILNNSLENPTDKVAHDLLGTSCFVGWPHLSEAKVVEVSDGEMRYKLEGDTGKGRSPHKPAVLSEEMSEAESVVWGREVGSIQENYQGRRGIEIGNTSILLQVLPMMGRKYICTSYGQVTLEKQWALRPVPYALQTCVKNIAVFDSSYTQFKTLDELFTPKTPVFMLGWPHYGSQGEVIDVAHADGRVRVNVTILQEPTIDRIQDKTKSLSMQYLPGYTIAQRVGINSHLLSRITGTILVAKGGPENHNENAMKVNIGLNLKFNKKNEEVPGFTKKLDNQWLYSLKAMEVVCQYVDKFPAVFDFLSVQERGTGPDAYFEDQMFAKQGSGSLKAVTDFLKTLPCADVKPMKVGADIVDELIIKEIEKEVERVKAINKKKRKSAKMQVKPHLLFRPVFLHGGLVPDPTATYQLFDRVVSIREGFTVPFGLRGTIVGIHEEASDANTIYEVLFDSEFVGGIVLRCSGGRSYRCSSNCLINISHGERKEQTRLNPQAPSTSQTWSSNKGNNSYPQTSGYSSQGNAWSNRGGNSSSYSQSSGNRNNYSSLRNGNQNRPGNWNSNNASAAFMKPSTMAGGNNTGNQRYTRPDASPNKPSEFAAMWKQLQGSTETTPVTKDPNISLSDAAKALDGQFLKQQHQGIPLENSQKNVKNETNQRYVELEKRKTNSIEEPQSSSSQSESRTKIDINSLFGKASSEPTESNSSEFSAMMSSLEISQREVNLDGSVAYRKPVSPNAGFGGDQSLKVTEGQISPSSPVSTATYGRQLSLQELFAGVKEPTSIPSTKPSLEYSAKERIPPQKSPIEEKPKQMQGNQTHDNQSHGNQTHGNQTHGNQSHGNQSHGNQSHGNQSHCNQSHGNQTHGNQSHGNQNQSNPSIPQQAPPTTQATQPNSIMGVPLMAVPRPDLQPTLKSSQSQSQPPAGQHSAFRNPVMGLLEFTRAANLAPPMYDYVTEQKGQIRAFVTMGTGQKFFGSVCRTREEAAESAAGMTLAQMEKVPLMMMRMPHPGGVPNPLWRPNLPFSHNSAFSPVMTKQPPPGFGLPLGVPLTQPPPNFPPGYQARFPPPLLQPYMTEGHSGILQHPHGHPMAGEGGRAAAEPGNPFIPLQVTKKQKSPQKPTSSGRRVTEERGENSIKPEGLQMNSADSSSGAQSLQKLQPSKSTEGQCNSPVQEVKKSSPKSENEKTPEDKYMKQSKRNRSRLAANFNFT